jgi:acetolactate synthase I/III small subunit
MPKTLPIERHTLAIIVDNESGVLARVIGLFSSRGYNIESLTVAEVSEDNSVSRITIVTSGTAPVIEQIKAQLDRLVPVHGVRDLSVEGPHVERELALVKVKGAGDKRVEAMRLADVYRARVVDATTTSFVFEITGSSDKVESFVHLMGELGLVEVARTGVVAMARGDKGL